MPSLSPSGTSSSTAEAAKPAEKPILLVVDDEEGPRQSVKIIFKEEYQVLLASDGQTGIDLAGRHDVSVAVLDILMAGMSGVEVLRRLKEIKPSIEVIMLTAYETIETARQALRYGACDYLNKPFDIPTMRSAVARAREKHDATITLQGANQTLRVLQQQLHDQKLQEEMVRAKGEIYASVLHDINSPLTVISGFVEMITRSMSNSATVEGEKLETIKDDLHKLNSQVSRCFEISRRYLGFLHESAAETSHVSVNQIFSDLKELLLRHPASHGHQLLIHEMPVDVYAEANGTDLLQILLNLTINALHASDKPHRVDVEALQLTEPLDTSRLRDDAEERFINSEGFLNRAPILTVSVQDNGPGMEPEIATKVFETRFTTKPPGKGTGLGLSIVKRLVREANGAIHLRTRPGYGSTFTVYLPTRQ